jgi:endoglycosylceramidase
MKRLLYLFLPILLIACSDSSDHRPREGDDPLELLPLHAEPDITAGGAIVDSAGREVILRGVNVNAYAEYWQGTKYSTTFAFTERDAEAIAAIGWNVVRLLLSWSLVEPAPGQYDEAYLDEIAAAVDLLSGYGIYTIVDLHQDAWGPSLAAREDEDCPAGWEPAFGWDGAPAWATLDGGADRCTINHIRELSPAVRNTFSAFFSQ